jgi:hypothetical protein
MGEHKNARRTLPTVVSDFLDSKAHIVVPDGDGESSLKRVDALPSWAIEQTEAIAVDDVAASIKDSDDTEVNPLVDLSGIRIGLPFAKTVLTFKYHFDDEGTEEEEAIFLEYIGLPPASMIATNPLLSSYSGCKDCLSGVVVDRSMDNGRPSIIVGSFTMGIDDDGYAVRLTDDVTWELGKYFLCIVAGEGGKLEPTKDLSFAARVTMATLCLLGCRNISATKIDTGPRVYYESRHRHKQPRYHVLNIEPMRKVFRTESGGDSVSLAKALHICRGHFKNFDDKPLFGRLKGTYWWQPHVRGTAEAGVVEKDYRIKMAKP